MSSISRRELIASLFSVAGTPRAAGGGKGPLVVKLGADPRRGNLARGLRAVLGSGKARNPFAGVVGAGNRVGIKVNCLAGPRLSPRPELVDAIIDLLVGAGVKPRDIVVFEREARELTRAGFRVGRTGAGTRIEGIDNRFEAQVSESGPVGSCYATLVTRDVDRLISVGVLKDHDIAGVSISLKNFYGVIHNPNKYHMNGCSPYVAHVVNHPAIRKKLFLSVVDADRGQYHGGPAYNPRYTWQESAIYLSTDPVAVDTVGWRRIEEIRRAKGKPPLKEEKRAPVYIREAARLGLGVDDPDRIRILNL